MLQPSPTPVYQKHCPGCYAEKGGEAVCPVCGYDESAPRSTLFLPHGVVLAGQYRVGRVLGAPGGFGITYIGWDVFLQQRVAIKEYLPRDLAARLSGSLEVRPHTEADRPHFDAGRERFLREARIAARFQHPHIVRVRSYFNANGTAYLVMDYYEGISLGEYLGTVQPVVAPQLAVDVIKAILQGLQYVHEQGVIHRDVKPANIYLAAEGRPILLDFGAATPVSGARAESRMVMLTEGYAPLEQYQRRSPLGPYTDVYAAAATLYRMLTGEAPPMALDRLGSDPLQQGGYAALPPALRAPLARALALQPDERYSSAAAFLHDLDAVAIAADAEAAAATLYAARHRLPEQHLLVRQETHAQTTGNLPGTPEPASHLEVPVGEEAATRLLEPLPEPALAAAAALPEAPPPALPAQLRAVLIALALLCLAQFGVIVALLLS